MALPDNLRDRLFKEHELNREECVALLQMWQDPDVAEELREEALRLRREIYGNDIYLRGLIEFTNICKNDCFYCGIRKSNPEPERYRMKKEEILACCENGYKLGLRTFVLQGGEDGYYTDEKLVDIVSTIKKRYPDCALTLSTGERSYASYKALREAGADRYLLREETADEEHYHRLHPEGMSLHTRMNCLYDLTSLDYQVGAGFMVGSPYQTLEDIAEDLVFIQDLEPEMVGIGPFIPHHDTRFADFPAGSENLTLFILSVIRILLPDVLLPATTALATLDPQGRVKGMEAGANVMMPNISPRNRQDQYTLYDNKSNSFEDAVVRINKLKEVMEDAGFTVVFERGDHRPLPKPKPDPAEKERLEEEERAAEKEKKKKQKEKQKEKQKQKQEQKQEEKQKEKAEEKLEKAEKKEKEKADAEKEKQKKKKKKKKKKAKAAAAKNNKLKE